MANSYIELMKIVNQGNKMGLSNTITRDNGIPLDLSSVQESYEAAVIYAATKAIAYQGQLLAAEGVVYVIVADSQGEYEAADGTKYQNYLKPVGTAPKGDNASISVTAEGLVSLYGFANAENGKLPMKVDGTIVWRSLEDIGAGDGNDDTTYTFELNTAKNGIVVTPLFNGQPIMEGEEGTQTQKKFEIVLDVYTKAEADEKFLAKADYTPYDDTELEGRVKAIEDDYLKAADKYDDTDVKDRLTAIEGDYLKAADKYDDTALAGRVKAIEDDYLKAEDKYDDTALAARVKALEDEERYDDTALTGRVETLETASADHEARIGKVEDFFKTADGESLSEAMDTLIEIQKEIASDNEGAAAMLADIQANTTAIATLNSDATTDGSVDKKIADAVAPLATTEALNGVKATAEAAQTADQVEGAIEAAFTEANLSQYAKDADVVKTTDFETFKGDNTSAIATAKQEAITAAKEAEEAKGYAVATEVSGTYATKTELAEHAEAMENTLETTLADYAKTEDVDADLATKVESATIAHAVAADAEAGIEAIPEGVTKEGTTLKIVVDAPTRAETIKLIADKVADVTGGESAADVKLSLESEVTRSTAKDEAHDAALAILNGDATKVGSVAEAKALAQKGVDDAAAANTAITNLANGQVATNKSDLEAVKGRLTTLETAKGDHETRIASAEGKITSLETSTANNATAIGTLQGKDNELVEEDARLAGLIDTKANAADVYTKTEVDNTVSGINTEIGKKANAADVYTKTEVDDALANLDQSELEASIKANSDAIAALIGDVEGDNAKSARDIAKEEVAAIVGAAPEAMNTLEEVATWISNDESGAAAMANDIAALKTTVGNAESGLVKAVADNTAAIAALIQPKASTEISVAEDGTLGILAVSTDKLVQGTETLVLNGGSAV